MTIEIIILDSVDVNGIKMVPVTAVKLLIADLERKFNTEKATVRIHETKQAKNADTT